MRYGHFDDTRREYVITRPDTPLPWINYLGTDAFFGIISNTAGGYSCYRDARLRRITRYRYNSVPPDSGGRYVYLRDNPAGVQRELWYHGSGCQAWLIVTRDTLTHAIAAVTAALGSEGKP